MPSGGLHVSVLHTKVGGKSVPIQKKCDRDTAALNFFPQDHLALYIEAVASVCFYEKVLKHTSCQLEQARFKNSFTT